jgi:hypothetical protein
VVVMAMRPRLAVSLYVAAAVFQHLQRLKTWIWPDLAYTLLNSFTFFALFRIRIDFMRSQF